MLAVGQAEEDVEVLAIDEIAGEVKVKNAGEVQTLNFKDNGVKPAGGPAPTVGAPGVPPPAFNAGLPKPATAPGAGGFSGLNGGFPPRTPRMQTGPQTGAPASETQPSAGVVQGAAFQPGSSQALPEGISQQQLDAVNQRSPEENVILWEATRLRNEQLSQQSGVKIPNLGPHPYARGLTAPAGQQAPQ
jgi:hypothetical protein